MNLITDRTAADVERYLTLRSKGFVNLTSDERAEWLSSMKGAYNYTDLNRVEEAVQYVAERLRGYGYSVEIAEQRTWSMENSPTLADMETYLGNVESIRNAFSILSTTPPTPSSMHNLTYQAANDIEQILFDVNKLLDNMILIWFSSGDLYSGEV